MKIPLLFIVKKSSTYFFKLPYQTDDSAVFLTTVSKEYATLLKLAPMSVENLRQLCVKSVSYAFATDEEKDRIASVISSWWDMHVN